MNIAPEDALRSFAQAAPSAFVPPPVAAVQAAGRRRQTRNTALVAAIAVAGVTGGVALAGTGTDAPPPQPVPATAGPAPSPDPTSRPPDLDLTTVDWKNVTLTLPPQAGNGCPPGGTVTLREGTPAITDGIRVSVIKLAVGDLTGDGRAEAVALVHCEATTGMHAGPASGGLAVFTATGGAVVGLGWAGPVGENIPGVTVDQGQLVATVEQRRDGTVQQRTFTWDGTTFRQTAGPTAFPS
ncbi:hypothetical protein ACFPIJ_44585 [Dactylosporangium cerinum]|uniref:Uncharacterized protein n=1 Tax=Dactylosporangium cerinum TaxID=1434730 RepID=A0ABV9WC69_9ACTN